MTNLANIIKSYRYALLRYTSIFIGIINAFLLPYVFNLTFKEEEFSFILVLYGYSLYLNFLDFGLSKPLYSLIRNQKVLNKDYNKVLKGALFLYGLVFTIQILFFFIFAFFLWYLKNIELSLMFIILFTLTAALTSIFGYVKSIFWAVDKFEFIEKIEILQRIFNSLTFVLLIFSGSLILSFAISNILAIILLTLAIRLLLKDHFENKKDVLISWRSESKSLVTNLKKDSLNNFIFSINETLIYNSGFIIFPFFLLNFDIIIYGLWIRLFSGIALFMRAVSDIKIHDVTTSFFNDDYKKTKSIISKTIIISLIIVVIGFIFYLSVKTFLFHSWVDEKYIFSNLLDISLFILLLGNTIQHISGTFISSIGGYYNSLKSYSLILMIIIISSQLLMVVYLKEIEIILSITSTIYFIGALFYFLKMVKIIRNVGI